MVRLWPVLIQLAGIALFDPVTAYIKVCVENTEEIIVVKEGNLIMKNLIIRFDEDKVSVKETDPKRNFRTVWYDITPIVKSHAGDKSSSVMEYVAKIEAEVCDLYDDEDDYIFRAREEFEDIINAEYRRLGIFQEPDGLNIKNDARRIRLIFANGSTMDVRNSEWGSITLS